MRNFEIKRCPDLVLDLCDTLRLLVGVDFCGGRLKIKWGMAIGCHQKLKPSTVPDAAMLESVYAFLPTVQLEELR